MRNGKRKSLISIMAAMLLIAVILVCASCDTAESESKPASGTQISQEDRETSPEKQAVSQPPERAQPAESEPKTDAGAPAHKAQAPEADTPAAYASFADSLFIGDSRTEGFKLYAGVDDATFFCAKAMTVDRIVNGEKVKVHGTQQSVYDVLGTGQFKKVYIGLGLNELGWVHIETFLSEYKQLIDAVKAAQPNATIYVQALLPVTAEKSQRDATNNNAQVYWYNTNLVKLAQENGVVYVNAAAPLVDDTGALKADATTDGVHLNSTYCKVWAAYLAEIS